MLYCLRLSEYIYLVENKKVVEILKEVRNSASVFGVSLHQLASCFRPPKVNYTFTGIKTPNPGSRTVRINLNCTERTQKIEWIVFYYYRFP